MRFAEFKLLEATRDPDIADAQSLLKDMGYDLGPTGVDGIFGPYTKAAIEKYMADLDDGKTDWTGSGLKPDSAGTGLKPDSGGTGIKIPSNGMPAQGRITGVYGRMVKGPNGNMIPHPGVDIAAPEGTPVVATDDGAISLVKMGSPSAGNYVELMTKSGEKHRFLHLSKVAVNQGDKVKKGQTVGLVGSTGYSTGPHLHWEKYASGGQQVNPLA